MTLELTVDPRSVCGVLRQFLDDNALTIAWLEKALANEGLLVCTAAERAVLDAMVRVPERTLQHTNPLDDYAPAARAELARREAKP